MQRSFNEVLLEFLTIINYRDNKQKYIQEFEKLSHGEAIVNIIEKFPPDLQEKVKIDLNSMEDLTKYISKEDYLTEVAKVSYEALHKFFQVISPVLTLAQKQKIDKLIH